MAQYEAEAGNGVALLRGRAYGLQAGAGLAARAPGQPAALCHGSDRHLWRAEAVKVPAPADHERALSR